MSDHKQKPWVWVWAPRSEGHLIHEEATITDQRGYTIATTSRELAPLMTAAPDLLEALEAMQSWFHRTEVAHTIKIGRAHV